MAEALVSRIFGTATPSPEARISAIRGTTGSLPQAFIASIRGTATGGPEVWISAIRGQYDAAASAPTAVAGQAVTVPCGAKVTLTGSGSPKGGATIASWSWRVVSKSSNAGAITFSDSAGQSPTFRCPLRRKVATYTFGLTVTDSAGRVSPESTVVVTVEQAEILKSSGTGWAPAARRHARSDGSWS